VAGAYYDGDFNLAGGGKGCVLGWCEGGHGVISSKGIGVCIDLSVDLLFKTVTWSPGFTITYHPFNLDLFTHACDVSGVEVPIVKPTRRRSAFLRGASDDSALYAHAAGFKKTFQIKDDLPGAIISVVGSTAPPRVTIAGPKGRAIDGTASTLVVKKKDYSLLHDAASRTTYVVLLGPAKGTWTLSVPDGSSPVVSATMSEGVAKPSITTKVVRSGGKYKLDYKVADQAGLKVEFGERSGDAYASLGTVKPGVGSLPFVPARGPKGTRKIVATLYAGSRPRENMVVGQYVAPAPTRPEDVSGLVVKIKGGAAKLTWDKSARAVRYAVAVTLSDGRTIHDVTTTTSYAVADVGRGVKVSAKVTPVDARALRGDADSAKASTPGLPTKLALGIKDSAVEIKKDYPPPAPGLTLLPSTKVPGA
jgi:hypothetical protein